MDTRTELRLHDGTPLRDENELPHARTDLDVTTLSEFKMSHRKKRRRPESAYTALREMQTEPPCQTGGCLGVRGGTRYPRG